MEQNFSPPPRGKSRISKPIHDLTLNVTEIESVDINFMTNCNIHITDNNCVCTVYNVRVASI